MQHRADENAKALACLHASGVDLDFLDSQYASDIQNSTDLLSDTLASSFARIQPAAIFFPLGLFHEDHICVSDVLLTVCHRFPTIHWFAYEDIPYRKKTQRVQQRLAQINERGVIASPCHFVGLPSHKAAAVNAYQSQFHGLGYDDEHAVLEQGEHYWHLHSNAELL